jgi:hypothetical protein
MLESGFRIPGIPNFEEYRMRAIHRITLSLGLVAGAALHGAALAAPDCRAVQRLSPLENRLAAWAGQGVTTLRQRATATKGIYNFNIAEAMETGMRHHEARKACGLSVADAAGAVDATDKTP